MQLPGEAAERLGHRVEAVPLHDEDLQLHKRLDVLCQVLQTVTGQVQEHLEAERRRVRLTGDSSRFTP